MRLIWKIAGLALGLWMILRNVRSVQFHLKTPVGEWSVVKRPPATKKQIGEIVDLVKSGKKNNQ